jgi:hypothetical protein
VSRVTAVRAASSRRFIGSWAVLSGYGRCVVGVWGVVEVLTDLVGRSGGVGGGGGVLGHHEVANDAKSFLPPQRLIAQT